MFKLHVLPLLPSWLWLTLAIASTTAIAAAAAATPTAKSGCPTRCGDLVVPYPFGIGVNGSCSFGFWHSIRCETSFNPPKAFYGVTNIEVVSISETQLRIKNNIARRCYQGGLLESVKDQKFINLAFTPFAFSHTANKFTIIGCDDFAILNGTGSQDLTYTGCIAACTSPEHVLSGNGSCSGIGCCQTNVPKGMNFFVSKMGTILNHLSVSEFNPCGYAFVGDKDKLTFNITDLSDPTFQDRTNNHVPVVIDWFVGKYQTCRQAQQNLTDYACQQNSNCTDSGLNSAGYRCSCLPGYEGNPYLPPGCTDIDECASHRNPCSKICTNTPGSYICTCPKGHKGDGLKNGTGCTVNSQVLLLFSLGLSFAFLFLVMSASWIYITIGRKKLKKKREIFFKQNGGLLLKEQLLENDEVTKSSKIFSEEELRSATKNYRKNRFLGEGSFGRVYKGILKDGREVAIKKAIVDKEDNKPHRINEFINEVVTLFQVNHQNVVKLIGCCLETEVPLLVYEFVSNGTLKKHINKNGGTSWLNWKNTVRVATEAASGLAYLHSAVSTPVIHRDVKSANILLDDQNTAKIADFGASRLAAVIENNDIIGTRGYIDPEYYYTHKITEKSDVYSFGIVLAELVTKEEAEFSTERYMGEECARFLGGYFLITKEANRVKEILDSQLVNEASEEQLIRMADLVSRCLNPQSEKRPSMNEVACELERMQDTNLHPWAEQNNEETTRFIFQSGPADLFPVPSNNSVYKSI